MNYYRVEFLSAPVEEGPDWRYKKYKLCNDCGLKYLDYAKDFLVPDDRVAHLQAGTWDPLEQPLLKVAGVVLAEKSFAEQMENEGITGFTVKDAEIVFIDDSEIDGSEKMPVYKWIQITGRCFTNDVWRRVVSVCQQCKSPKTEAVKSNVRKIYLNSPYPETDLCLSREEATGLIISEKFKFFIENHWPSFDEELKFVKLENMPKS